MKRFLLLRLEAPLMSFGGVAVDNRGVTERHPGLSALTGLLGNALGWLHRDTERLQALQGRLCIASRLDRRGQALRDYQTVDLGQAHLVDTGWTTRGKVEKRAGAFSTGTHIRNRDYRADSVVTVAIGLDPEDQDPSLADLARALERPARPLFIGRKCCLPSAPLLLPGEHRFVQAQTAKEAVLAAPLSSRIDATVEVCFSVSAAAPDGFTRTVRDQRDWRNNVHTGRRFVLTELVNLEAPDA